MLLKCTYFAHVEKYFHKSGKQHIIYMWDDGENISAITAKTTGSLSRIHSITKEEADWWKESSDKKNLKKLFDYNQIEEKLTLFGNNLKKYAEKYDLEYFPVNCDKEREERGYKKLRDFEERMLLNALKGK
jgi:hypothetical protein